MASQAQQKRGPIAPNEPAKVIDSLLDDFDEGTRGESRSNVSPPGIKSIDTSQIAAMSITLEII